MKLFSRQNFREMIQGFDNSRKKYPLTLIFSFLASILFFLRSDIIKNGNLFDQFEAMGLFCGLMIPTTFAFHISRRKKQNLFDHLMLSISFLAVVWTSCQYVHVSEHSRSYLTALALIAAHCLVACAFINHHQKYFFWDANILMLHRFIFATVVSVILASGVVGLIYLFSYLIITIHFAKTIAIFTYCFSGFFIHSWIFVSGCDFESFEHEQENQYLDQFKYLKYFLQYVYIPMVILYALTLILYLAKIAVLMNLPKGAVSYFVVSLSGFGILAYLLSFRFADHQASALFRLFRKFFFYILCPLLVLLWISVWKRVSQYGVTPDRYLLIILSAWLSFMTIYILLQKSEQLSSIPPSTLWAACIIMLLTPLGPSYLPVQIMTRKVHRNLEVAQKNPESETGMHVATLVQEIYKMRNLSWMKKEFSFSLLEAESISSYDMPNQIVYALKLLPNGTKSKSYYCNRDQPLILKKIEVQSLIVGVDINKNKSLFAFDEKSQTLKFEYETTKVSLQNDQLFKTFENCRDQQIPDSILLSTNPPIIFYPEYIHMTVNSGRIESFYGLSGTVIIK